MSGKLADYLSLSFFAAFLLARRCPRPAHLDDEILADKQVSWLEISVQTLWRPRMQELQTARSIQRKPRKEFGMSKNAVSIEPTGEKITLHGVNCPKRWE